MADPENRDTLQPMTSGDTETPPATTDFTPAEPLKNAGVQFAPEGGTVEASPSTPTSNDADQDGGAKNTGPKNTGAPDAKPINTVEGAKQALLDGTADLRGQAGDRARGYAEQGKSKATDALGQLSQLLTDAAGQVDDRLGDQYGQYARMAADRVQSFSSTIDDKSVDELIGDARALVRKSPAVAVGAAAALGFVVARLLSAGVDQRDA